ALYPGSFDPITFGHIDVVRRACHFTDKLVLAVGVHHGKKPVFTKEERFEMINTIVAPIAQATNTDFEVVSFDDLVVDAAMRAGATIMIRGLRDGSDFDYEMQLSGMNEKMAPHIQTVFVPSSGDTRHITASLVRQIATMSGDITPFVPDAVKSAFDKKLSS
uniref:pantetheine-phosphate adenylyltransferase n=1 Tax=Cohaesibacter celericrescens TaxID=2067669 RepID=UPI003562087D